ncbi:amino acid adenylation domain-containing protein [Streptomyces sp. E11-3]|uniref:amino acid adenylation domain-containing protein n=1 Tax=Streptomyces sp. E11-3 TaxID=3110112 RepID=UPI00397F7C37
MTEKKQHALYERFLRGLALSPDRPALRVGAESVSYRALHERALALAGALHSTHSAKVVGVLADKSVTAYAGILAGLYAGATVVPLHPDFPAGRTRRMLELSGVAALIADARGRAVLAEVLGDALDVPVVEADPDPDSAQAQAQAQALAEPRPVSPSDVAYMLFTSGSTGRPKGVPISHGSTCHYFELLDERYDFTPDDVFSQTFDLNFDCAMFDLFCAWGSGGVVEVVPPGAYRELPSFLADRGVTVWFSTPSAITLVRRMGGLTPAALSTLRWSFFAGEALRCQDAVEWQAAAPGSTLENIYGPTELTVTITGHRWDPATSPERAVNGMVPIGQVHQGHDHVLLDEDGVEVREEGELLITGAQMATGYLDPEDNRGRFVERDGRVWYRTGDRVRRLPDGELVYLGRLDSQVQVQGWRVELAEIDHALRSCDGVEDVVTVARPVDGSTVLVVFYTGVAIAPARLARELRDVLPKGMLPRHYEHVERFPLNSNRKIDRPVLAQRAGELLSGGGRRGVGEVRGFPAA